MRIQRHFHAIKSTTKYNKFEKLFTFFYQLGSLCAPFLSISKQFNCREFFISNSTSINPYISHCSFADVWQIQLSFVCMCFVICFHILATCVITFEQNKKKTKCLQTCAPRHFHHSHLLLFCRHQYLYDFVSQIDGTRTIYSHSSSSKKYNWTIFAKVVCLRLFYGVDERRFPHLFIILYFYVGSSRSRLICSFPPLAFGLIGKRNRDEIFNINKKFR